MAKKCNLSQREMLTQSVTQFTEFISKPQYHMVGMFYIAKDGALMHMEERPKDEREEEFKEYLYKDELCFVIKYSPNSLPMLMTNGKPPNWLKFVTDGTQQYAIFSDEIINLTNFKANNLTANDVKQIREWIANYIGE